MQSQNILKKAFISIICKPTKLALVVRGDLKMSKGKTAAQCAHAAILCFKSAQNGNKDQRQLLNIWCIMGQPKIVLRVDNYEELINLQKSAVSANVVAEIVRDAGRTQLEQGSITVLGLGPATVDNIDKIVSHLKLL